VTDDFGHWSADVDLADCVFETGGQEADRLLDELDRDEADYTTAVANGWDAERDAIARAAVGRATALYELKSRRRRRAGRGWPAEHNRLKRLIAVWRERLDGGSELHGGRA